MAPGVARALCAVLGDGWKALDPGGQGTLLFSRHSLSPEGAIEPVPDMAILSEDDLNSELASGKQSHLITVKVSS
jgi:hypothetical protein